MWRMNPNGENKEFIRQRLITKVTLRRKIPAERVAMAEVEPVITGPVPEPVPVPAEVKKRVIPAVPLRRKTPAPVLALGTVETAVPMKEAVMPPVEIPASAPDTGSKPALVESAPSPVSDKMTVPGPVLTPSPVPSTISAPAPVASGAGDDSEVGVGVAMPAPAPVPAPTLSTSVKTESTESTESTEPTDVKTEPDVPEPPIPVVPSPPSSAPPSPASPAWVYPIDAVLKTDYASINLTSIADKTSLFMVTYRINTSAQTPYLEYLLYKYPAVYREGFNNLMIFPFKAKSAAGATSGGDPRVSGTVAEITDQQYEKILSVSVDEVAARRRGFLRGKYGVYVFYETPFVPDAEVPLVLETNQYWWCILDEIINYRMALYFPIQSSVTTVFLKNSDLCYLLDGTTRLALDIPSIGYHGTTYNIAKIIANHGMLPSRNAMMGQYYYFGTFRKAVRYAAWTSDYKKRVDEKTGEVIAGSDGRYMVPGGIVRMVVFMGRTRVFLNHADEPEDRSELMRKRVAENPSSREYEETVVRLHDHEGKWTENYDSAYVGRVALPRGGLFVSNPEWIVKSAEQYKTVSRHELRMDSLKPNWDPDYDGYRIM